MTTRNPAPMEPTPNFLPNNLWILSFPPAAHAAKYLCTARLLVPIAWAIASAIRLLGPASVDVTDAPHSDCRRSERGKGDASNLSVAIIGPIPFFPPGTSSRCAGHPARRRD